MDDRPACELRHDAGSSTLAPIRTSDMKSPRSIKAYPLEEGTPSFEASADSGAPAAVCPGAVSALVRASPAIVAFALDAVAPPAVFWPHQPAAGRAWRVPALAAAELSVDPVAGSREADSVPAGASGPTRRSAKIAQPAERELESRLDELLLGQPSDWVVVVVKRRSDYPGVPPGGHSEGSRSAVCSVSPACLHSDWRHSAARAGRCGGPVAAEGYSLRADDSFELVLERRGGALDDPSGDYSEDCWAALFLASLPGEAYSRQAAD